MSTTRCAALPAAGIVKAIPLLKAGMHGCFTGSSGCGKSTGAKALVTRENRAWPTVAFDPEDEYSVHGIKRAEIVLGTLRERVTWDEYLELEDDVLDDPRLSLAIVPDPEPKERALQLAELARDLETTGGLLIVLDEVGNYSKHAQETLDDMAARCRKWGTTRGSVLLSVETRLSRIPITMRANTKWFAVGFMNEPADVDAVERRCGHELAEEVQGLPLGHLRLWAPLRKPPPK